MQHCLTKDTTGSRDMSRWLRVLKALNLKTHVRFLVSMSGGSNEPVTSAAGHLTSSSDLRVYPPTHHTTLHIGKHERTYFLKLKKKNIQKVGKHPMS